MAWAVSVVLQAIRNDDHQLIRRNAELAGCVRPGFSLIPIVKPMLAVIVVQGEQPADPDDGMPFRESEPVSKVTILVRDHERIKLINVREDLDCRHRPLIDVPGHSWVAVSFLAPRFVYDSLAGRRALHHRSLGRLLAE